MELNTCVINLDELKLTFTYLKHKAMLDFQQWLYFESIIVQGLLFFVFINKYFR
jgi:hypothetical protein